MTQKKPRQKTLSPEVELVKATAILTHGMWGRVLRDAEVNNRSESYVLREIVGLHYKLPPELRNPPRRPRRKDEEIAS